jgi:hypothetical protein
MFLATYVLELVRYFWSVLVGTLMSRYFTNRYRRKTWLIFRYHKIGSSSKKGGFGPLLEHSAPLLREKGLPTDFFKKNVPRNFKKEFLPNPTVQKNPTGYTNWLVPVPVTNYV